MSQNQNSWLDDPEWEELRQKTGKKKHLFRRKSKQPPVQAAAKPVAPPTFLKQPSATELQNAVSARKQPMPPASSQQTRRPQFSSAPPSYGRTMPQRQISQPASKTPQLSAQWQHQTPKQVSETKPFFTPSKDSKRDKPVEAYDIPADKRPVQVSINLSLPTMDTLEPLLDRFKHLKSGVTKLHTKRPSGKRLKLAGGVLAVAVLAFGAYSTVPHFFNKQDQGSQVLADKVEKPTYAVTKPDETKADQVKFDAEKQVASYGTNIGGTRVTVSQQPLPDSFKTDPFGQLDKLATSFSATQSFTVSDFKVYIGTSAKGPQSLILIKDKKLIFLRSDSKIPNTEWVNYIETMKT